MGFARCNSGNDSVPILLGDFEGSGVVSRFDVTIFGGAGVFCFCFRFRCDIPAHSGEIQTRKSIIEG